MHRLAARQAGLRRPQRVIGRGYQHLIAIVKQSVHGRADDIAGAIAHIYIFERDALHALLLRIVHHRFARRKNAFAV